VGECLRFNEAERDSVSVVGKLKSCLQFWRDNLKANKFILDIIQHGYTIPFVSEPPPAYAVNNKSALSHSEFVRKSIEKLLLSNVVRETSSSAHCCNPLTVAMGRKLRLVLDLSRFVNPYVKYAHFKYEDWSEAEQILQSQCWFFNWDFTSGYHHVSINPRQSKYLGFSFDWPGIGQRFFEFTQLPFGLNSACYLFTKLTRPLIKCWRAQGLNVFIYIDDGLAVCEQYVQAWEWSVRVQSDLSRAGFVVNQKKSHWEPTKRIQWLGFIADADECKFYVAEEKLKLLDLVIDTLLIVSRRASARDLAKFVGRAVSMERALGRVVRLMSRSAARLCAKAPHWEASVQIDDLVIREMRFLRKNSRQFNGQLFIARTPSSCLRCFSDASDTGYGSYVIAPSVMMTQGTWSPEESSKSSTWRELAAVNRSLIAWQGTLAGQTLLWHCDNAAVVRILDYGSNKLQLQMLAVQVAEICFIGRIRLLPVWIPRGDNQVADELSRRSIDGDDWQLDPYWFRYLDGVWGPHTVDRFADNENCQIPIFNSRVFCPGTSGVDAFSLSWADQNNWLCPPIGSILRVLEKVRADGAVATLIVPQWESSFFWPTVRPNGSSWHELVKDVHRIPAVYLRGRHTSLYSAIVGSHPFWTLALRLEAS
jgi:hypothetical protein